MATFEDWAAKRGYTQRENGDWTLGGEDDGPADPGQLEQDYARAPLFGEAGGPSDPGVRDGVQYVQIGSYANNDPDQAKALQLELDHLKRFGITPVNDPQYGWIAPDDAALRQAHPAQQPNSFDRFLSWAMPALIQAGMMSGIKAGFMDLMTQAPAPVVDRSVSAGDVAVGSEATTTPLPEPRGIIGVPIDEAPALSSAEQAAVSLAEEWTAPNVFDELAFNPATEVVGGDLGIGSGLASTIESVAPSVNAPTELTRAEIPQSKIWDEADRLVGNAGADQLGNMDRVAVGTAENADELTNTAAANAATATPKGDVWDSLWRGLTSDKAMAAAITGGLMVAGGVGTAMVNRETMQDKAALDLTNAQALQQAKTDQSRANRFTGLIGVRPAATRAPLQRLTGGPVYNERGLIRRA